MFRLTVDMLPQSRRARDGAIEAEPEDASGMFTTD
jgi:hypothetical protein